MDNTTIGVIAFFVAFFVSRIVSERAMRRLSEEQASVLVKSFSRYHLISLACVALIAALYFTAAYYVPDHPLVAPGALTAVIVAFLLGNSFLAFRKLKRLNMPDDYITQFLFGTLVQYAGIFAFLYLSASDGG